MHHSRNRRKNVYPVRADQVIVVCKTGEAESIQYLFEQLGTAEKLRGTITKLDLKRWYSKCFQSQYRKTLGRKTILSMIEEMKLEFPLAIAESFELFYNEPPSKAGMPPKYPITIFCRQVFLANHSVYCKRLDNVLLLGLFQNPCQINQNRYLKSRLYPLFISFSN